MPEDLCSRKTAPVSVRPIRPDDLNRIPLRCWPSRDIIERLFAEQGTIGMAAWEGQKCVGELHGYRVMPPGRRDAPPPEGSGPWAGSWWDSAWPEALLALTGPVWLHACFHVGRTLETYCAETLQKSILPRAQRGIWDEVRRRFTVPRERSGNWDEARILNELRKRFPDTDPGILKSVVDQGRLGSLPGELETHYLGRGIGTALCQASVQWAWEHDYTAVIASGAPRGVFEFAAWSGHLPWSTYAKLGFQALSDPKPGDEPDHWISDCPPEVQAEVRAALESGRAPWELNERWMVLFRPG